MNYRLSWKILLKNKWILYLYFIVFVAMFYEPVRTIYNATNEFSNVSLPEINYSFMPGCIIWFSVMLFTTHELISRLSDNAGQVLWISSKKQLYRKVFKFSVINDAVISGLIVVVEIVLFICFGKGIIGFLFKEILDVLFYYFLVGIIAILIAMLISFINNTLLATIIEILTITAISSLPEVFDNMLLSEIHKFFEILPQGTDYGYIYGQGRHINIFSMGLIILWISLVVFFLIILLDKRISNRILPSVFGVAFGLYIVNMPYVECFDSSGYNNPDKNIYASIDSYDDATPTEHTNEEGLEKAGFTIKRYEMDVRVRWKLNNTVRMWVDNTSLESYTFTLYHKYEVMSVTDQKGNELEYEQDKDILRVIGTGNVTCIIVEYNGSAPPCEADFEAVRLYAGFPWYPYPGEQNIVSVVRDEEFDCNYTGYTFCKNNISEYSVNVSSPHKIYLNLQKDNDTYEGETDMLMLAGGMLAEEIEGNVHYIYPVELSYCYNFNNGIEDWKDEVDLRLAECERAIDITEDFYCFQGLGMLYMFSLDSNGYVLGENIFMLNSQY